MDNLVRPGGLSYIKVHEKTAMKMEKEKQSTNQDRKSVLAHETQSQDKDSNR